MCKCMYVFVLNFSIENYQYWFSPKPKILAPPLFTLFVISGGLGNPIKKVIEGKRMLEYSV